VEVLDGDARDLDMVSVYDGWAIGSYNPGGGNVPRIWHYTSGAVITPTSLGRVKAAFR